ncbi:MAG: Ig-like domain-containing protein [Anaerolineales bacterium]
MSGFIRIKRSTFRIGIILLYAFFLSLIAYTFIPQMLVPKPGEKSLRCQAANLYVGLARAAGENCTTKCTNWEGADCSGYSSCFNKNISCTNGVDQDGRPCQGCCYDCTVECTPIDEPPSISGSIACGQWGSNGWCVSSARLKLTASDPQGYALSITGNAKGSPISCNGNCSIDLPTGSGVANYVVTASNSGMSASGSASWDYDPDSPSVGLNISGSSGKNGWYTSSVGVTPTGSDSISGLAGTFLSVNGGAWQSSATLDDGKYTIDVTAADRAGNTSNSSATISVDTKTPSISVKVNGKPGKNNWFDAETTVSASASDATSGIASFEVSVDGGSYRPYSTVELSGGRHTVQFRATDKAGNRTETAKQSLLIDLNDPTVTLDISDFSDGIIAYSAHDGESGMAYIYITIEDKNGKFSKIKWSQSVSGKSTNGEYRWDKKVSDGTVAPAGEYTVWVKAVNLAGNEDTQATSLIISGPVSSAETIADNTDLKEQSDTSALETDDTSNTESPSETTYGGDTNEAAEITDQSLSLEGSGFSTAKNPFPWELILGATTTVTAAAVGAKVYTSKSKKSKPQRSEEQKQATRARLLAELEAKWDAAARAKKAAIEEKKNNMRAVKMERIETKEYIERRKTIAERQKSSQKAKKDAELKAGLEAYYNGRKLGEQKAAEAAPPKEKPWWEKVGNLFKDNLTPQKVVPALLVTTLALQGISWIKNTVNQSSVFLDAKNHAEVLLEELRSKHPSTPENLSLSYIVKHPYNVFSTGIDVVNTFSSIGASYADAVWQQNPIVQFQNKVLEKLENSLCPQIDNQSWSNRCTAGFYLASGINSTPFDTTLGVINGLIVDPISGFIKQETLVVETLEFIPSIFNAFQDQGWQGGLDFTKELLVQRLQTISSDKQIQSALFFESLILAGMFLAPLAAGVILGTTINGLINLDVAISNTEDKKSLIEFVTNHETRTMVVSSLLVLAMMGLGVEQKFSEFKAFQDSLSPEAKLTFQKLSLTEQTRVADIALKQEISSSAVEFYLQEIKKSQLGTS